MNIAIDTKQSYFCKKNAVNNIQQKISNLVALGEELKSNQTFKLAIENAQYKNNWFTEAFVQYSVDAIITQFLQKEKLEKWLANYPTLTSYHSSKTLGIIMAGNIPLVGFHDFLCAYLAGVSTQVKMSSKDDELFQIVLQIFSTIDESVLAQFKLVERLEKIDLVIATGSDNTHRYFEQYFASIPRLLRKSRTSVAILNGEESTADLDLLADDIFLYFGMGCRNISQIFVPENYDITRLFPHFEKKYKWLHHHSKYMNNYDYLRAILLLNREPHFANEFIMLLENNGAMQTGIAKLQYSYYADSALLEQHLMENIDKLQVVATNKTLVTPAIQAITTNFGNCQLPALNDYPDGVDILDFLLKN